MTSKEKRELETFLRTKVLGEDFDLDESLRLREYIKVNSDEENGGGNGAFCDYFELGNWFYEAMEDCDFEISSFLDEVEQVLQTEYEKFSKEQVEAMDDYLATVGAK